MQLVQPQTTTGDFNTDLIQAQREALSALREVMAETADPADDDNTRLDDDDLKTRAARFRRLSLRLRAATAILRVKPLTETPPAAPIAAPAAPHTHTSTRLTPPRAGDPTRDSPPAPQSAAPNPHAPCPAPQQPRVPDPAPQRTTILKPVAALIEKPSATGSRS